MCQNLKSACDSLLIQNASESKSHRMCTVISFGARVCISVPYHFGIVPLMSVYMQKLVAVQTTIRKCDLFDTESVLVK